VHREPSRPVAEFTIDAWQAALMSIYEICPIALVDFDAFAPLASNVCTARREQPRFCAPRSVIARTLMQVRPEPSPVAPASPSSR